MKRHTMKDSNGFTIIEIAIVVPILMILALSLLSIITSYIQASGDARARLTQTYTVQSALDRIEADARYSPGFLATNPASTPDPSNTSGWDLNGSGANNRVLIMSEYATDTNPASSLRSPIYIKSSDPTCADSTITKKYTIVYFVDSTTHTLYRRTLIDNSATCVAQYEKLSCPEATPKTGGCSGSADDEVIATNITKLSADYYVDGSTATALNPYGSPAPDSISNARSINVTIGATGRAYGGSISSQQALRTTTINIFGS